MNRSIKFRFYSNYDKEMYQLSLLDVGGNDDSCVYEGSNIPHETYDMKRVQRISDGHLMQYTGLKDKNGTEIYEGDILGQEIKGRMRIKGAIKFGNYEEYMDGGISDWTGFYLDDVEDGPVGSFSFLVQKLGEEVIGNIHEHPHLLERD